MIASKPPHGKRRSNVVIGCYVLEIALVMAVLVLKTPYNGTDPDRWLTELCYTGSRSNRAAAFFLAAGPEGVTFLSDRLRTRPKVSPVRQRLAQLIPRSLGRSLLHEPLAKSSREHLAAVHMLGHIGAPARSAVPILLNQSSALRGAVLSLYNVPLVPSPDVNLMSLASIAPENRQVWIAAAEQFDRGHLSLLAWLKILERLSGAGDEVSRSFALAGQPHPDRTSVRDRPLEELKVMLRSESQFNRLDAAHFLGRVTEPDAALLMPTLVPLLRSTNSVAQAWAVAELRRLKDKAREALPALVELQKGSTGYVSQFAELAIMTVQDETKRLDQFLPDIMPPVQRDTPTKTKRPRVLP